MRPWKFIKSLNETLLVVIVAVPMGILFYTYQSVSTFICPEDYPNKIISDESERSFMEDYLVKNPDATIDDFTSYRYGSLVENNCKKTLEYIGTEADYQQSVINNYNGL